MKNMKKIIIYLLLCCFLSSCDITTDSTSGKIDDTEENNGGGNQIMNNEGVFESVVSYNIDFNDTIGAYTEFVLDQKTALEIGDIILKKIYGEEAISNTQFIVREVMGEGYFVITRMPVPIIPGFDYNIAINRDGKILKIWMGE